MSDLRPSRLADRGATLPAPPRPRRHRRDLAHAYHTAAVIEGACEVYLTAAPVRRGARAAPAGGRLDRGLPASSRRAQPCPAEPIPRRSSRSRERLRARGGRRNVGAQGGAGAPRARGGRRRRAHLPDAPAASRAGRRTTPRTGTGAVAAVPEVLARPAFARPRWTRCAWSGSATSRCCSTTRDRA